MRGQLATTIRRYVDDTYPYLSDDPLYLRMPNGVLRLAKQCKRERVQAIKRQYNKQRRMVDA